MITYDEKRLSERLTALPPSGQAVFAAGCSERLLAVCASLGEAWGQPVPAAFATTQQAVWRMCAGQRDTGDVDELDAAVSAEVPHDDEDWDRLTGYL